MPSHANKRPSGSGPSADGGWTPVALAAALGGQGDGGDVLARTLLGWLVPLAARELLPWSGHYRRSPASLGEDVVQDVMLKLFADRGRVLRTWDPERGLSLRGFLRRVVRFHVLQLFRSSAKNPWRDNPVDNVDNAEVDTAGDEPDQSGALLHQLWLWEVRDLLLAEETDHGRALYMGLFVEQRSADEVGALHEMSRDAVYQWRSRFKRRASRLLSSMQPNGSSGEPSEVA